MTTAVRSITLLVLAGGLALVAFALGPHVLPYQYLVVLSGSMEPALPVGSVAIFEPVPAGALAVGDVITFQHPSRRDEFLTHRIVGVESGDGTSLLITKGDANGVVDEWRVPGAGTGWRVAGVIPALGYVLVGLRSPVARAAFVLVPLAALCVVGAARLVRARSTEEPDDERAEERAAA